MFNTWHDLEVLMCTTVKLKPVFYTSSRHRAVPPPRLRPWQGFGNGCNLQEHIDYGACLDGRCCTRHSIERKNALRVVQFLGERGQGPGQNRGQRRASRRHGPIFGHPNGNGDRSTAGVEGRRQQDVGPSSECSPSSPLSPLSAPPSEEINDKRDAFSSTRVGGVIGSKAKDDGGVEEPLMGDGTARSSSSRCLEESGASCSSAGTGTLAPSTVSAGTSGGDAAGGACSEGARAGGRRRTPLHFASERGELALVDR